MIDKIKQDFIEVKESLWFNLVIAGLAVFSIFLLIYEFSVSLSPETVRLIHIVDITIACLFLLEFFFGWWAYSKKGKYFKENWLDLLSSIPVTGGVYRSFRFLRILRLLRVVRIIQIRRLGKATESWSEEASKYFYLFTVAVTVLLAGAISFFTLEVNVNPGVDNFFDALWWTVSTATVGYGDIFPVTWEGRLVGMILMLSGVIMMGVIAGFVGGHIFNRHRFGRSSDLAD